MILWDSRVQGVEGSSEKTAKKTCQNFGDIGDVERMLKALIKSLENKRLNA